MCALQVATIAAEGMQAGTRQLLQGERARNSSMVSTALWLVDPWVSSSSCLICNQPAYTAVLSLFFVQKLGSTLASMMQLPGARPLRSCAIQAFYSGTFCTQQCCS